MASRGPTDDRHVSPPDASFRPPALRIASTLGLIALLGGLPLTLLGVHAPPPLHEIRLLILHPTQIQHALSTHLSDGAAAKILWAIAWLVWAWFTVCVGVEVLGRVPGRTTGKIPASTHVQSFVRFLIGASLALGIPSRQASPLRLQVASVSAPARTPSHRGDPLESLSKPQTHIAVSASDFVRLDVMSREAPDLPERTYVVEPHDSLWSISEKKFGTPLRWQQIAAANYGRPQPDGKALADDHWILPGWILVIPAWTNATAAAPPPQHRHLSCRARLT